MAAPTRAAPVVALALLAARALGPLLAMALIVVCRRDPRASPALLSLILIPVGAGLTLLLPPLPHRCLHHLLAPITPLPWRGPEERLIAGFARCR
jgi:hypothetical protein